MHPRRVAEYQSKFKDRASLYKDVLCGSYQFSLGERIGDFASIDGQPWASRLLYDLAAGIYRK